MIEKIKPENIRSTNYESFWTTNPKLQEQLRNTNSYIAKLALIANQTNTSSPFSLESHSINPKSFAGNVRFINIAKAQAEESTYTYTNFERLVDKSRNLQESFSGPKSGSALEMFLLDISHDIFGKNYAGEKSSILDDTLYGTDAIFLERPFVKTRFMFGVDFTFNNESSPRSNTFLHRKILKNLTNIRKDREKFNIIYGQDSESKERFSAYNVPKLICYINSEILEELAAHYYKLEHEKLHSKILTLRKNILVSLIVQARLYAAYSAKHSKGLSGSYSKAADKLSALVNTGDIKLSPNNPTTGKLDEILQTLLKT